MTPRRIASAYVHVSEVLRLVAAAAFFLLTAAIVCSAEPPKPLFVYFIDVEGGQSTLFVTPSGESLLIDTGWDGFDDRDADRIVAAAKDAGLAKIDYVLITHYHSDHVGGVTQLAARFPVGAFIDHGENSAPNDQPTVTGWNAYQKLLAEKHYKRISVKPGDVLPIHGAEFTIVNGGGKELDHPLSGAGQPNENCKTTPLPPADHTENEFSLGLVMNFGKIRLVDLGDLPWVQELRLMCPANKLGRADIYVATHHGIYYSGSPALVHGIAPRVAFVENSAKKGGSASALDIIHSSPGISATYQLHWSEDAGADHNSPPAFLANLQGADTGHYLKLTANLDGSLDVHNSRTAKSDHYPPR
jgi:competence protein ComEC